MLAASGRKLKAASTQKILSQMTQLPQTQEGGLSADRQSVICTMHHQDMSDVSHKDHSKPILLYYYFWVKNILMMVIVQLLL